MARPRSMRNLLGVLKDQVSIFKAAFILAKSTTSSYHIAVLRATTHDPSTPPPEYRIEDVLSLGLQSRPTATACIDALINRLHQTRDAFVALKCLITIHNIIQRGSIVFKDQISTQCITSGGNNFLNLSTFRDDKGTDSWELSAWVRWYAGVIERCLAVSRFLGFYFSSPPPSSSSGNSVAVITNDRKGRTARNLNSVLLKELSSLVDMVEEISNSPETLHYQRLNLIYEVMKLVGEDYRMTMREVFTILSELDSRNIEQGFSTEEMDEFLRHVKKLENCREKLILMFLNKKRNDGVWEMIAQMRKTIEVAKEKRENMRLVTIEVDENRGGEARGKIEKSELSRATGGGRRSESWKLLLPPPAKAPVQSASLCIDPWLDVVDRNSLTLSMARSHHLDKAAVVS